MKQQGLLLWEEVTNMPVSGKRVTKENTYIFIFVTRVVNRQRRLDTLKQTRNNCLWEMDSNRIDTLFAFLN